MKRLLFLSLFLAGCTAQVAETIDGAFELRASVVAPVERQLSQSGSVFLAKFATVSALNSTRSFVSDYHGEVRFTVYPNEKMECRWWAEGRDSDVRPIEATSTLCTGRLQHDDTFAFQGAYMSKALAEGDSDTFTLRGRYTDEGIIGELIIGSVFRNDITITDTADIIDTGEGVRFEAVRLE